jgi:opacity protein-like surface antigen
MKRLFVAVAALLWMTPAAFAQTETQPEPTPAWTFWVRGNAQLYENFFQAVEGGVEEDVTALYGEAGANLRLGPTMRAYGSVNYLHYNEDELNSSPGVRLGLRNDAQPHSFDIFVEQLIDRPSFDVGDEFDRGDIRTIGADYGWRFLPDWQLGVHGELQQQEFDITSSRDNDFAGVGASIRWRATRLFSPELGVRIGNRDVDTDSFSYGQRDVYLQIRSSLTPKLYLSGRIRDRRRDYDSGGREDTRRQLTLGADYSVNDHLAVNFYGAHETTDVNLAGRDFDSTMWMGGLTWKF